jgi:hypothetical protein
MAKNNKRIRLTDESVNSYGTRIITAGVDLEQYKRNPVLLYMHERGQIIGLLKDLKVEGKEITAEPVFDEASELSQRCKKQYEFGSLRMSSIGIDILEMSHDKELLSEGQTRPTITKSRLFEVSLVDIGANSNALVLRKDGRQITLGQDGENPLPQLINNNNKKKEMDIKTLALQLGLPETADEATVNAKLAELQAAKAEADKFRKENEELQLAQITAAVEAAVSAKKISEDKKAQFVELGKKVGLEVLNATFEAMAPQMKLSETLNPTQPTAKQEATEYKKLSEVPADKIMQLRTNNPEQYRQLFKAEYGFDCEL